ncbi:MAG: hypothetical protein ACFE0R_16670 [Salinarimonas sp.]
MRPLRFRFTGLERALLIAAAIATVALLAIEIGRAAGYLGG